MAPKSKVEREVGGGLIIVSNKCWGLVNNETMLMVSDHMQLDT